MLVLSRKRDEDIVIGSGENTVVVRVLEIAPDRIKLGVIAPNTINVFRQELLNQPKSKKNGVERQGGKQPV
jgi:carbon storage regulator CsrA